MEMKRAKKSSCCGGGFWIQLMRRVRSLLTHKSSVAMIPHASALTMVTLNATGLDSAGSSSFSVMTSEVKV